MFERAALIHYHEIGLKGRNRPTFEKRLGANIASAIADLTDAPVERIASRLIVRGLPAESVNDVCARIALQPGVGYASPVYVTSREQHDLDAASLAAVREVPGAQSFAVDSRRSNTDHPVSSMEMNRIIGQHIVDETGLGVNLDAPDVTAWVEVVGGEAFIFSRKYPGTGGLPVGSAGKVVVLLSAGIDSPVAAWRMAKRGAVVVGVHFSGQPHTSDGSVRLVDEIAHELERFGAIARVYAVPFGDLQKEISLSVPPDLRVILYRRLMIRVAEAIAAFENGKALVTGESLGQVASQTLENIAAVDEVAASPVLRPLIGFDKLEIIAQAREIGTYELSIQAHEDCCTLFMPRTPETHATLAEVLEAEEALDSERMVCDALSRTTYRSYVCPAYKEPWSTPDSIRPADG
jgi:thiamine biosynthesis protein ThiI